MTRKRPPLAQRRESEAICFVPYQVFTLVGQGYLCIHGGRPSRRWLWLPKYKFLLVFGCRQLLSGLFKCFFAYE